MSILLFLCFTDTHKTRIVSVGELIAFLFSSQLVLTVNAVVTGQRVAVGVIPHFFSRLNQRRAHVGEGWAFIAKESTIWTLKMGEKMALKMPFVLKLCSIQINLDFKNSVYGSTHISSVMYFGVSGERSNSKRNITVQALILSIKQLCVSFQGSFKCCKQFHSKI